MLTKVKLYGVLGQKFGKEHEFDIEKPAEAVQALLVNYPEFEKTLVDLKYGVKVYQEEDSLYKLGDFHRPMSGETIKIVPVIAGADWGDWALVIIGALLIYFAWWVAPVWMEGGFLGATGLTYGQVIGMVGAALLFTGLSNLLYVAPKDEDKEDSYIFSGPVNTVRQGNVVPVGYGQLWVGSQVISGGFYSENLLSS